MRHLANRDRHWDDNMESPLPRHREETQNYPESLEVRNEISSPCPCRFRLINKWEECHVEPQNFSVTYRR